MKVLCTKLVEDLTERGVAVMRIDPIEMFEPGGAQEDQARWHIYAGMDPARKGDDQTVEWAGTPQLDPNYMLPPSCTPEWAENIVLEPIPSFLRRKPSYRYVGRVDGYDMWERQSYGEITHEQYQRFPLVEWVKVQA